LGSVTLVRHDGGAVAPGHFETVAAFCSAGQQPIGGGGRSDAADNASALTSSRPTVPGNTVLPASGSTLQGWQVTAVNYSSTNIHPSAWAICAS
jgi:hypothetical protein